MKIRTIKIINNKKIGNIELDFTINGIPQDTIILAGNNGSGKTTILDEIYYALDYSNHNISNRSGKVIINFTLDSGEKEKIKSGNHSESKIFGGLFLRNIDQAEYFEYTIDYSNGNSCKIYPIIDGEKRQQDLNTIFRKERNIMPIFYSTVGINYNFGTISTVTSGELDPDVRCIITDDGIGRDLKQTFIDIDTMDNSDFAEWARENSDVSVDSSKLDRRMSRFSNAFSYMFSNIKYYKVTNEGGHKDVLFKNNMGDSIKIDDLSTGEKQIVIRAGYMLKFLKTIQNGIILIDEPELSLHPEWQMKIVNFYKKLFTDENGHQTAQIFVATHSPFVIHDMCRYNDKIFVLKRGNDGVTVLDNNNKFYSIGESKIISEAFNINDLVFDTNMLLTEGPTDKIYIEEAINVFFNGNVNFSVDYIGENTKKGARTTGYKWLDKLLNIIKTNPDILIKKIGLLYDCDTNKGKERGLKYFTHTIDSKKNNFFERGIENLLNLPPDFEINKYYDEQSNGYKKRKLNKKKLCEDVCNSENKKEILINFKQLITEIEKEFDT